MANAAQLVIVSLQWDEWALGGKGALLLFGADWIKMSASISRDHPNTKNIVCVRATGSL